MRMCAAAAGRKGKQGGRKKSKVKYNDESDDEDLLESDEKEAYRYVLNKPSNQTLNP